jgi:hypothetical protein
MAGVKETPRQRMIGMMYLVLTALLALQIKDAVLEKFVLIENGLKESNVALKDYNNTLLADIQSDVVNQGNKTGDQAVAKAAENIRNYTNGLIADIQELKLEVGKAASGSNDPEEVYRRAVLKKYEEPSNVLVNKGKGLELKGKLDEYPKQVNAAISTLGKEVMSANWAKSLAIDANDIDFYKNNKEEKNKSYEDFNFYKAPLASVLAQLTFYENQLYSKEGEVMNYLADLVGAGVTASPNDVPDLGGLAPVDASENTASEEPADEPDPTPSTTPSTTNTDATDDSISEEDRLSRQFAGIDYAQATILSPNNTVTAGLDFEAKALLTLGNSAIQPTIRLNGEPIEVVNGKGLIKIPARASANEYDANDLAEKSFEIEIEAADGSGETITRKTIHNYSVARPVIKVESKSVQVLYRDCANDVNINVPSLGPAYNPSFSLSAGSYDKGPKKGNIIISPAGNQVRLGVSSSGQFIDNVVFPVRSAPSPEMTVLPNGTTYKPEDGLKGALNNLVLSFSVDADWKTSFPNDASFLASKGTVLIQQGTQVVRTININSPVTSIDMRPYRNQLTPGTNVIVKLEEVTRINFKNKQIKSPKFANATISIR